MRLGNFDPELGFLKHWTAAMGYSASQENFFSLLPESRPPWAQFVFSASTQGLLVALLLWVRLLHPEVLLAPEHTFRSVQLVSTPVPVNHEPQPPRVLAQPALVAHLDPPTDALRLPAPQPRPPVRMEDVPVPTVSIAVKKPDVIPVDMKPAIPKPPVRINVFSQGSSQAPTIARAPSQVQTGGFGDPNGIPAKANSGKAVNIAQAGSFDLPSGPGYGNGTGGAKGVRGAVASSGFGNSVGTGDNTQRVSASPGTVQQTGFGDAAPVLASGHSHSAETAATRMVPAEILSKPTPTYTEEARNLRIQ